MTPLQGRGFLRVIGGVGALNPRRGAAVLDPGAPLYPFRGTFVLYPGAPLYPLSGNPLAANSNFRPSAQN